MDPFDVVLRVASAMFWVAAAIVGIIYRLFRMLFFFWRKHHRSPLVLPLSARFEHTHIVGGSGHGKTQLLQQLILYDLERVSKGEASLIVIDSQGDMLGKIRSLASVGKWPTGWWFLIRSLISITRRPLTFLI
jgi:Type IV secretion-system coupling protein DNA-binding domain